MLTRIIPALLCGAALLVFPSTSYAQDTEFRQGVDAFEQGRFEEAAEYFRKVLEARPSAEQALRYRDEAGYHFWVRALARQGRLATYARRILRSAEREPVRERRDEDALRKKLSGLWSDDFMTEYETLEDLIANYGHYVVPQIADVLSDSNDEDKVVRVIHMLARLGDEGTLAVMQLLKSDNPTLQRNAAIALGYSHDVRAIPPLKKLAETGSDSQAKSAATQAIQRISGPDFGTAEYYARIAEEFYRENPLFLINRYPEYVVWKWRDGKLDSVEVPRFRWNEEVAEEFAYQGLSVEPNNSKLWTLLLNVYAKQWTEVETSLLALKQAEARGASAPGDEQENLKAMQARMAKIKGLVASRGPEGILNALGKSLADQRAEVAVFLIERLAEVDVDPALLGGGGTATYLPPEESGSGGSSSSGSSDSGSSGSGFDTSPDSSGGSDSGSSGGGFDTSGSDSGGSDSGGSDSGGDPWGDGGSDSGGSDSGGSDSGGSDSGGSDPDDPWGDSGGGDDGGSDSGSDMDESGGDEADPDDPWSDEEGEEDPWGDEEEGEEPTRRPGRKLSQNLPGLERRVSRMGYRGPSTLNNAGGLGAVGSTADHPSGGAAFSAALGYGDKRVRFAAAIAAAKLNPPGAFPGADRVVPNLIEALGESGQRVVLVVEPDRADRNRIVGLLRELGYMAFGVEQGRQALIRARSFPSEDLIIVSSELNPDHRGEDPIEVQVIDELSDDYRTKTMKVMVLTERDEEMQRLVDAGKAVDLVSPGISKGDLADKLNAAFGSSEDEADEKTRSNRVTKKAAEAIAGLRRGHTQFPIAQASGALVQNVKLSAGRPPEVRLACLAAISAIGPEAEGQALSILASEFRDTTHPNEVRAAMARAMGDCLKGKAVSGDVYQVLKAALAEDDAQVWEAAFYALGKPNLTDEQAYEVFVQERNAE